MYPILPASATTEVSKNTYSGSPAVASLLVLEVVDDGSWNGVIKVAARAVGRGAGAFDKFLAITNRLDGGTIDGSVGITAAGIYEVNIAGLDVQLQHNRSAGQVSVYGAALIG